MSDSVISFEEIERRYKAQLQKLENIINDDQGDLDGLEVPFSGRTNSFVIKLVTVLNANCTVVIGQQRKSTSFMFQQSFWNGMSVEFLPGNYDVSSILELKVVACKLLAEGS